METPAESTYGRAEELLDALRLHRAPWAPFARDWVFRGQRDASWDLTPSSLRSTTEVYFGLDVPVGPQETLGEQLHLEGRIVREFLVELDRQGIPSPQESDRFWRVVPELLEAIRSGGIEEWPPESVRPLFALAQHYGVPTRFLDWSERPLVAAYFAAKEAADRVWCGGADSEELMAIWAFNHVRAEHLFTMDEEDDVYPTFRVVRPPRWSNPNLRAQEGLSTLVVSSLSQPRDTPRLPSLDELLAARIRTRQDLATRLSIVPLRKLRLPVTQAPRLLRLLAETHVSGTYLFPGIRGSAIGLLERGLWDVDRKSRP